MRTMSKETGNGSWSRWLKVYLGKYIAGSLLMMESDERRC